MSCVKLSFIISVAVCFPLVLSCANQGQDPGDDSADDGTTFDGTALANGIYPLGGVDGLHGTFVLDTSKKTFICIAGGGGHTIGGEGNILMVMVGREPLDRARFDTVLINGQPKNRVQFTGDAITFTINNRYSGAPGNQGSEPEILFDELTDCTFVTEAIDDDENGDRWETTITGAEIWPDGTRFTNVTGISILDGDILPIQGGNIAVTIGRSS